MEFDVRVTQELQVMGNSYSEHYVIVKFILGNLFKHIGMEEPENMKEIVNCIVVNVIEPKIIEGEEYKIVSEDVVIGLRAFIEKITEIEL